MPKAQTVYLRLTGQEDRRLSQVLELLRRYPGSSPVKLYFADQKRYCYPPGRLTVSPEDALLDALRTMLGPDGVALK